MTRTKRLTDQEKMEIVREAAAGVSTSELAERFGVTARAVRYTLKADEERKRDAAIPIAAVTIKLTPEELGALDEVLAAAGIKTRTDGLRRLIQAAGGTFVPDAQLAAGRGRVPNSPNCGLPRCAGWRGSSWMPLTKSTCCCAAVGTRCSSLPPPP